MMRSKGLILALAFGLFVASAASGQGGAPPPGRTSFLGLSLQEALQILQAQGVPVVFSSSVVRDSLRVESEPRGATLREILDELLRPHGLRAQEVLKGRLVVVADEPPRAAPPRTVEPIPMPSVREEIVVTPGRNDRLEESPVGTLTLNLTEAAELPHLGNDSFRALGVLPGAASGRTSTAN